MILVFLLVVLIILIGITYLVYSKTTLDENILCGLTAFVAISLVILILLTPVLRFASSQNIRDFNSVKQTIEDQRSRENASESERLMMADKIIETNSWLDMEKYKANNIWVSIFVNKDVLNLERIK